ncbi:MAG TPA: 50S ribosomal protein L29 [bacterium]|nr:50S ribosomal protein L29 [bacterium]
MKASELRGLSIEELNQKINESEEELFNLRMKKTFAADNKEFVNRKRELKKTIAVAKTILNEKKRGK